MYVASNRLLLPFLDISRGCLSKVLSFIIHKIAAIAWFFFSNFPVFDGVVRKIFGKDHPLMAVTLSNRGVAYLRQNNFPQAIKSLEESLRISRKLYGENHFFVAASLNNLGNVYFAQEDLNRTIEVREKALEIFKAVCGEDDLNTATCLDNLGMAYKMNRNFSKAIASYNHSLRIFEKKLGENHELVADNLFSLGVIHEARADKGDLEIACDYLGRSLEILKNLFGEKSPRVRNISVILNQMKGSP